MTDTRGVSLRGFRPIHVHYWTWKPWRWRFYLVRRSKWGPFGELLIGPVSITWAVRNG